MKTILRAAVALLALLVISENINAEIEQVTITWRGQVCDSWCAQSLHQQFSQIPGVASAQVDGRAGRGDLQWKPNFPFSFTPLDYALRYVGVSFNQIRLRVRGQIAGNPNALTVISNGDGTPFALYGSIIPQQGQYTINANIQNHALAPQIIQSLLEAQANRYPVVIEGHLFEPWRSPVPLQLIVERYKVILPQQNTPQNNQPQNAPQYQQKNIR